MDRLVPRLNGPRGAVLLGLGWIGLWHGVAYMPVTGATFEGLPSGLQMVGSLVPLGAYGSVWFAAGVVAVAAAFTDREGYPRSWERWGYSLIFGLSLLWSCTFGLGWVVSTLGPGETTREWVAAAYYGGLAVVALAFPRTRNPFPGFDLRTGKPT